MTTSTLPITTFICILIVHFLADFALQTHEQASKKSTDIKWLSYHVATYSAVWFLASFVILDDWLKATDFAIITFMCHWVTDFITSRIGKPYWENKDLHNGFVIVGFDQVLHYVQLILTFKLLS